MVGVEPYLTTIKSRVPDHQATFAYLYYQEGVKLFRTNLNHENVCALTLATVCSTIVHLVSVVPQSEFLLLSPLDIYYYITLLVICQAYFYKFCKEFADFLLDKNTL